MYWLLPMDKKHIFTCAKLWFLWINLNKKFIRTTTTTVLRPFVWNHPGEPVPEENFWTLWCKGRLTEADTLTIWLDTTPSWLTSVHHHPPVGDGGGKFIRTTQQPFYGPLSGTTRVSRYQKKHSPTHHPDHHPIFISFFHLPRSIASSLFKLRAWQSFCTTSFHVLFGLPLGLEPSTSYSIHFFTQSVSSFCCTCPYHRNLFCCSINIISSIPSLSLNSLLGTLSFTLTSHIHLTILISARWSATSFSFLTGQVSLLCSILLRTQVLHKFI